MRLVRVLFDLDRADEAVDYVALVDEGPALEAELLRRRGDAAGAKARAEAGLAAGKPGAPRYHEDDLLAALALAELDLGNVEAAAKLVERVAVAGDMAVAIEGFQPSRLRALVEARRAAPEGPTR
jgi:hypothetical protein